MNKVSVIVFAPEASANVWSNLRGFVKFVQKAAGTVEHHLQSPGSFCGAAGLSELVSVKQASDLVAL